MFLQANYFASGGPAPSFSLQRFFFGVMKDVGDGEFASLFFLWETRVLWAASGMMK